MEKIKENWLGTIPTDTIGSYIDTGLLCLLGGIPWQAVFQRVLACRTDKITTLSLFISVGFMFILAIPPAIMGLAGMSADWNMTSYDGEVPLPTDKYSFILPLTLNYLTPLPVAIIGIGAVAAACMSSADSCILSTSSVLTKNVYQDIFRPNASEKEIVWVLRINIVIFGTLGTLVAIFSNTIYGLFVLCADLMYVVLFPQLTLVLWMESSNAYGSLAGFLISFGLRLLSGEDVIGLPPLIKFPYYDEANNTQMFPFRTLAMLLGTFAIITVSLITNALFLRGRIPMKYDIMKCHRQRTNVVRSRKEKEAEAMCNGNGNHEIQVCTALTKDDDTLITKHEECT